MFPASRYRFFGLGLVLVLALESALSRKCLCHRYSKSTGSSPNSWVAPGYPAQISYILNEPATGGVSLQILSGTNLIKSFFATNGQPGALLGSNSFVWDGTDLNGSNVTPGLYNLQITAGAAGYADWTNINREQLQF